MEFCSSYSSEAGAFRREPMMSMLPGFTGFIATIGLLGAALIRESELEGTLRERGCLIRAAKL